MKAWFQTEAYERLNGDNKIAAWAEYCRALEQRLELVRDELMRVRDVVGEVDAELIDKVLEYTANNGGKI